MSETLIYPSLGRLEISSLNVRRTEPTRIEELAALIKSQGLLQNLVVVKESSVDGHYEVIAGGRRLRALQLLASRGDIDPNYPVPCIEASEANAVGVSVAENTGRESMHPADEFEAFQRMHTAGESIEDIAAQFGVSPLVVTRRLKLANVMPTLIQLYRAGEVNLDQLMALAITDDQDLQEAVWNRATGYMRSAHHLRAELTKNQVSLQDDKRLRFVGLAAYEAAGGPVTRDLFSNEGDGYITDVGLLAKLFDAKLEAHADQLRAEGWAWVKVCAESLGYSEISKFGRSKPTSRELTADEISQIAAIEETNAAATKKMDAIDEDDDSDMAPSFDDIDTLERQIEARDRAIKEIRARTEVYSERQMKKAGAMVGLSYHGVIEIHRGLIEPMSKKDEAKKTAIAAGEPVPSGYSETLLRKLSAHRTAAMQARVSDCHRVALDLLCASMATQVIYKGGYYGAGGVTVTANQQVTALPQQADDMESSPAWIEFQTRGAELLKRMPETADGLFDWLTEQPVADVHEILAFCTASCLTAITGSESARPLSGLATFLGLDMADWWQPTVKSYLAQVPKAAVMEAVTEACGVDAAKPLDKMKKGDMVKKAEELLADTGWLPTPLRAADAA